MQHIPMVVSQDGRMERSYDIFSRLLKDRVILINGEITQNTSATVVAQLLFLASEDCNKDIQLYINSEGGNIVSGMAIYDTMNYIKCDVSTICMGHAASMGAFLLAGGKKGKRFILPNAEVMIHQPIGGARGQASDIEIEANHILKIRDKLNKMLSEFTGKPVKNIQKDTDRNNWMDAEGAKAYGLVDEILI